MWLRNPRLSTELSFKTHWDPVAPLFHGQELISKTSQRLCLIDVEERGDVGWDDAMAFPSPLVDEVTGSCWKVHVYPSEDGQCLVYFKRKLGPRTAASWNFCLCSQLYKSPFCWWQIHHIFIQIFIHFPEWKSPESYMNSRMNSITSAGVGFSPCTALPAGRWQDLSNEKPWRISWGFQWGFTKHGDFYRLWKHEMFMICHQQKGWFTRVLSWF